MSYHTPKPLDRDDFDYINRLWLINPAEGKVISLDGKELGNHNKINGYVYLNIMGRKVKRAHIIWWAKTREWPEQMLDHDNRIRNDDRFDNLKLSSTYSNASNVTRNRDLPTGVTFHGGKVSKYKASIWRNYKRETLGYFPTVELALEARKEAERNL